MFSLLLIIYFAFISLGLPDGLLGAGWPAMYPQLEVPVSYAGIISAIIMAGTIVSSLMSTRLVRWVGAGRVTTYSVATTALALFGFAYSPSFAVMCLWAIPYGLGAGGVDSAINNYAAIHYSSRHMNWLHGMWGVGAATGPYIMGFCIQHSDWQLGYSTVGIVQIVLTVMLFISLPQWKKPGEATVPQAAEALRLVDVVRVPGAKQIVLTFFCYCALEQTAMLWASTYFSAARGMRDDTAAFLGSLFLVGITIGRFGSGFLAGRRTDRQMIHLGMTLIGIGIVVLLAAPEAWVAVAGFLLIGLGCAPVYPSIIHSTPDLFGAEHSQSVVGVEMAGAYVGSLTMPPLFGFLGQTGSTFFLPLYLAGILVVMILAYQSLLRVQGRQAPERPSR